MFDSINAPKIDEGLIKTYSLRNLYDYMIKFLGATDSKFKMFPNGTNSTIGIEISSGITLELLQSIFKIVDVRGYFIALTASIIPISNQNPEIEVIMKGFDPQKIFDTITSKKITTIYIIIESKFDNRVDVPEQLFHVTQSKYIPKIKRIGLSPRHQDKLAGHPGRVYFTGTVSTCLDLATQFMAIHKSQLDNYVILEIDTQDLALELRADPNCNINGNVFGVYTYDNIPPSVITVMGNADEVLNMKNKKQPKLSI